MLCPSALRALSKPASCVCVSNQNALLYVIISKPHLNQREFDMTDPVRIRSTHEIVLQFVIRQDDVINSASLLVGIVARNGDFLLKTVSLVEFAHVSKSGFPHLFFISIIGDVGRNF